MSRSRGPGGVAPRRAIVHWGESQRGNQCPALTKLKFHSCVGDMAGPPMSKLTLPRGRSKKNQVATPPSVVTWQTQL